MQEHIKRMAEEAGLIDHENAFGQLMITHGPYNDELQRFALAVARECAEICDARAKEMSGFTEEEHASQACADAIRARFGIEGE